jgi:hypothetical protein
MLSVAARRGDTALCAYLHSDGCPWDAAACDDAAINGHASTLCWLREHGCPWHAHQIKTFAAQGGSVDALVYLQQQGLLANRIVLTTLLNVAGSHNKLQGAEWPTRLRWHQEWPDSTLVWARSEGCLSPL